jgi:hypothetical protein
VQRVQQHVSRLSIRADGARDTEQDDREKDEDAQHQTKGIEELCIGRIGFGHGNSLKFGEKTSWEQA